jgi:glycosyltransferase involved in cell wall biosynthesis
MKAAILVPVLASKDAVGADVLAMLRILEDLGVETRIFCLSAPGATFKTWPIDRLVGFAGGPDDLVIYHFSTGWPAAVDVLKRCRGYRVVRYHNITPAQYFKDVSADYENACENGRREIATIAKLGCELYMGASAYNVDELVSAGAPRARGAVLAPFHRVEEIVEAEADVALINDLTDGSRNFLMVGRVAPNKGHLDLIEAFGAYVRAYSEPARLILLGKIDPRLDRYTKALEDRIEELDLGECVMWINGASEAQLKAAYLASHLFMVLSEHEGFCVPLIESMAVGTPIVARATSAVPETLGDAGIAWERPDPWLYAASAARVFADSDLRNGMRERGRARYRSEYAVEVLRSRFLQHLEPVL